MGKKYFTISFDDGLEQDKRLVDLMKTYGIRGTFNLNSGLFGTKNWIERLGNLSVKESDTAEQGLLPKYEVFRLPQEEILSTYDGFEIAGHSLNHENFFLTAKEQVEESIKKDWQNLSQLTGQAIKGFAYPYGSHTKHAETVLKEAGIVYARVALSTNDFDLPKNPLNWKPTAWIIEKGVMTKLERFLASDSEADQVFCLWGHTYELDYGTKEASWEKLETIFKLVSKREDLIFCTNAEFFEAIS